MSVFSRYKRQPGGFRALVSLWETTPIERRKKMMDVGMAEDPGYTMEILKYMLTFEDILGLPEPELAELVAEAQPRTIAFAIAKAAPEVKERFIRCAKPPISTEIKDFLDAEVMLREVGGAQLKLIEKARELEGRGLIKTKRIPH